MATPTPELPNPLTSLAWLPPDLATQLEVSRYVYSATVGAWAWDLLISLPEDFSIFVNHRRSIADLIYVLSKMLTLGFLTTSLVFQAAPVGDCHKLVLAIGWCFAFAIPLNSLLFFFRIRAVFHNSRIIVGLFAFLWLATLGGSLSAPFGVDGTHIGTTKNCVNTDVKSFSSAGIVIVAAHDTLVLIAISIKLLMSHSSSGSLSDKMRLFLSGKGMGRVSRSVMQTGQAYYVATVGTNIVAAVVILTPSVPPVYRAMFSIPNIALQNSMACRVYRNIKLGFIKDYPSSTTHSAPTHSSVQLHQMTRSEYPNKGMIGVNSEFIQPPPARNVGVPVRVQIQRETDIAIDQDSTGRDNMDWKASDFA